MTLILVKIQYIPVRAKNYHAYWNLLTHNEVFCLPASSLNISTFRAWTNDKCLATKHHHMSKAVEFSPTFRTSTIYSASITTTLETLSVKFIRRGWNSTEDTTLSSTEVCYLDTKIVHGDSSVPFHISAYDKRERVRLLDC